MRLFLDTEFTGLKKDTKLISLGIITENNVKFYAEFNDFEPFDDSTGWIRENVVDNLLFDPPREGEDEYYTRSKVGNTFMRGSRIEIRNELKDWLSFIIKTYMRKESKFEIWSDVLAYDWVLFTNLFLADNQTMQYGNGLPSSIYYIPFDLATLFRNNGIDPDIEREKFAGIKPIMDYVDFMVTSKMDKIDMKHNALWDAIIIKICYEKIMSKNGGK